MIIIKVNQISKFFKLFKREAGLSGALQSFIKRKYEKFYAIKNINIEIEKGKILGILGENGAGKTTLIKLMVGLIHPSSGEILCNGYIPWERDHNYLKEISMVMGQKNQLWWDIPASESFLLNKQIYKIDDKTYSNTLNELIELFDIKDKINIQVRRLSLGERMKMEIIAALLHKPKIIFLDEPTLGLDVISQSRIREFIKYYNEQYQTTFIITSHYMHDIQELCKRVFVMHKGESMYDGEFMHLIKKINPHKRLIFEFSSSIQQNELNIFLNDNNLKCSDNYLKVELDNISMQSLINKILTFDPFGKMIIEELPVENTMKKFFINPKQYI